MSETENDSATTAALDAAFKHLTSYRAGSARGGLAVIDEAVRGSLDNPESRAALEQRLVAQLERPGSIEGMRYVCDQLVLIGSAAAVPALASLLGEPAVGSVARGALEALKSPEAAEAMRAAVPRLEGTARAEVLIGLGRCPDPANVPCLAGFLRDGDREVAAAAAAALGNLGTLPAAQALEEVADGVSSELKLGFGHACLDCAAGLVKTGDRASARRLYRRLTGSGWPEVIVRAARHAEQRY
jgi:HEAT repeat protein